MTSNLFPFINLNQPDWSDIDTAVVIQNKNFGDAVLLIPVLLSLRAFQPKLRLIVCTPERYHVFLKVDASIECVEFVSVGRLLIHLFRLCTRSKVAFLDFQPTLRFRLLGWLLRPKILSGLINDKKQLGIFDTHSPRKMVSNRRQYELNLDVLRRLGCYHKPELSHFRRLSASFCAPLGAPSKPYFVIHLSSRWMFKSLNLNQWKILLNEISERYPHDLVLTGGDTVIELEMAELLEDLSNVVSFVGRTSTPELIALLRNAQGYIGVDTFTSHLASLLKIPGVVIFGPTDRRVWGPDPGGVLKSITADFEAFPCMPCNQDGCGGSKLSQCLEKISIDSVVGTFAKQISRYSA